MSLDARTGNVTYNTSDLIGFARLGSFGQKSNVLLSALMKLRYYEENVPTLEQELVELRELVKVSGAIQEIVVQETVQSKPTPKK
jgi:hypothetical protein